MKLLAPGLSHREIMRVESRHTVPGVAPDWPGFADMPPVLATAIMVGFMEQTCITALRPCLQAGQHSVGTHVDMTHVAATPAGMSVTAEVELVAVDGRMLTFRVSCRDDAGLIGEGTHKRAIIDMDRFLSRIAGKGAATAATPGRTVRPAAETSHARHLSGRMPDANPTENRRQFSSICNALPPDFAHSEKPH